MYTNIALLVIFIICLLFMEKHYQKKLLKLRSNNQRLLDKVNELKEENRQLKDQLKSE